MSGPGAYVPAAFSAWSTIASNDSPSKPNNHWQRRNEKPLVGSLLSAVGFSFFFLMAPFVTYGFVCNAWICSYTTTYKKLLCLFVVEKDRCWPMSLYVWDSSAISQIYDAIAVISPTSSSHHVMTDHSYMEFFFSQIRNVTIDPYLTLGMFATFYIMTFFRNPVSVSTNELPRNWTYILNMMIWLGTQYISYKKYNDAILEWLI